MEITRAGLPEALVVDALEIPRFGFAEILRKGQRFSHVWEAADDTESLGIVENRLPVFALVALHSSGSCPFELIERLSRAGKGTQVLVVAAEEERLIAARALSVGARGVVNLRVCPQELLSAVDRILGGEYYLEAALMQQLFRAAGNGRIEDPVDSLSRREIEIFRLLGRGMTAREISLEVHLSAKTVEYHRQRIKEKLHLATTADLIRYAATRMQQPLGQSPESPSASPRRHAG